MGAERREAKIGKPKEPRLKDAIICSLAMLLLFFFPTFPQFPTQWPLTCTCV